MRPSTEFSLQSLTVMRGLDPRIHVFAKPAARKTWMAGSSPAMTMQENLCHKFRVVPGLDPGTHKAASFETGQMALLRMRPQIQN